MADYEGYLLLHDFGRQADPLYFELEGGLLQYYDKKDGRWMGQFSLTRHRVSVQAIGGGLTPNRFCVELCPVRSVHDTERSIKQFRRTRIVLGASTPEVQEQWISALRTWRRRNWKDTAVIAAFEDEAKALRMMMIMYRLELKLLRSTDLTLRKVSMDPQVSDPIYGDASVSKHQSHPVALLIQDATGRADHQLKFLKAKVLRVGRTEPYEFYSVEKRYRNYDRSRFIKLSNNAGHVAAIDSEYVAYAMAFSHWTWYCSGGYLMVVDLQGQRVDGDKLLLTDPAIHSKDPIRFNSGTNLGAKGFDKFFRTHTCNDFCRALKLKGSKDEQIAEWKSAAASKSSMSARTESSGASLKSTASSSSSSSSKKKKNTKSRR
ncbi:unnamed protein product [Phytophthora lilii]|uniref:Unnamed protein product n=1 Tax=Phytophthora lilii TaxID=2077276 RepID=A0A9W6UCB7_9STRA|nr:unnamed protein product [Phytophthora lilii]